MSPDTSHIPDYIADRGPAKYFHGRVQILGNFDKLIKDSMEPRTGSTFLIQGAPGAGKTALLDVFSKRAEEKKWKVAKISIEDLYTPAAMAQSLGKSYTMDHEQAAKAGVKFIEGGYVRSVAGHATPKEILRNLAPKEGLILVLDEAQYLINLKKTPTEQTRARDTLDAIHNGDIGRPVILLGAGLGQTEEAFRSLGISRFKGGCFVELGALGKEAEGRVLRDWLIKEGRAKGDPAPWIDAIAQKTHGWPQHITAYGDAAAKQIQHDRGEMTSMGLDIVYRVGGVRRETYYKQRAKGISGKGRAILAKLIQNIVAGKGLYEEDIEDFLAKEYNDPDKGKDLFKKAVERGVLHSQDEVYSIPIPSMQTWLISNYAMERVNLPPISPLIHPPSRERDSGIESMEH